MLIQSEVHVRTGRVAIPASGYTLILRTLVRDKVVIMSRQCLLFERTNFLPEILILLDHLFFNWKLNFLWYTLYSTYQNI